jgi:hypothetical protein
MPPRASGGLGRCPSGKSRSSQNHRLRPSTVVHGASHAAARPPGSDGQPPSNVARAYWRAKEPSSISNPAAHSSQPMRFLGLRLTITEPTTVQARKAV